MKMLALLAALLHLAAARTYYEILEVADTASSAEIRNAYRHLALRHHPDRSNEPARHYKFRDLSEAYEVLAMPERRRAYDADPHAVYDGRGGGFPAFWPPGGFSDPRKTFDDLFGDVWSTWQPGHTVTGTFTRGGRKVTLTIFPDGTSDESSAEAGAGHSASHSKVPRPGHGASAMHVQAGDPLGLRGALPPGYLAPLITFSVLSIVLPSVLGCVYCGCCKKEKERRQ